MYLIGVYNYFIKYIVQNSYNKISMGHFAHLRNQYNFPCYFPLEKSMGFHLNKPEFFLPKNANNNLKQ